MSAERTKTRLAICGNCEHHHGDRCDLLADWMSLASVACVKRNKCPARNWFILRASSESIAWPESLPPQFADSILRNHSE